MHWTTSLYRLTFGISLLTLVSNCSTPATKVIESLELAEPTTIFLVRHAEKDYGHDPNLTQDGHERAERLAFMLKNVKLDAIYSTDTRRTRQTAEPVATAKNLPIKSYTMFDIDVLARVIKRKHTGQTILVVGHSNTTPALTTLLAEPQIYERFSELDYTNFYVVTLTKGYEPKVLQLRF